MELFRLEHKKLWRKMSVKISVLLCFAYVVIFTDILSYQWFVFGSRPDYTGNFSAYDRNFDGYSAIRSSQQYGKEHGGELTDERLQQLVRDYQRLLNTDMVKELGRTDEWTLNNWLQTLYPELREANDSSQMISYVDPEKLTGFYGRRQQAIEKLLDVGGQTGEERELLLGMNEKVEIPFSYEWNQGWSDMLAGVLPDTGTFMSLFLAIALSTLFAGEWHNDTASLALTTKNGWRELSRAKICTGMAFTLELFGLLAAGNILSQLFFLGTTGWDMPIQNIRVLAVAPMNMLQAEIYEYLFALLGAIGFAGLVMLISAVFKNNFAALLVSLAIWFLPRSIGGLLPDVLKKAMTLVPLYGNPTEIFQTNTFHFFGIYVWSPWMLLVVPVLIGLLCLPITMRKWSKRLKV